MTAATADTGSRAGRRGGAPAEPASPRLIDVTFVVLDLETTGGRPGVDRITEVGAVRVRGGAVLGELQCLVDPGVSIPPLITALTGITSGMVARAEPIEVVAPSLVEFLSGAVLVAHNARFDAGFLRAALRELAYPPFRGPVVCTRRLARALLARDEIPDARLATLARHLGSRTAPCHRALADARATVDVFHALLERAATFGVLTLEDLVDFPRSRARRHFAKIHLADGLSRGPGVYLFRDAAGRVLYVGKAKDLRRRVRSYFTAADQRTKVADLLAELARVETVGCASELEAEVREVRLIQRHRPRYNRRARNPERYRYLRLSTERFPRLVVARQPPPPGAPWLGPFSSAAQAELVREAIEDALPIRRCTRSIAARTRSAPCILLELQRCLGPCTGEVGVSGYAAALGPLQAALDGDPAPLLAPLRTRMARLAGAGRYEDAARARERLDALRRAIAHTRRVRTLLAAGELLVARPQPGGLELTRVRAGTLVAVSVAGACATTAPGPQPLPRPGPPQLRPEPPVRPGPPLPGLADPAAMPEPAGAPAREAADELALIARWLDRLPASARVLLVTGTYASPVHGASLFAGPGRR